MTMLQRLFARIRSMVMGKTPPAANVRPPPPPRYVHWPDDDLPEERPTRRTRR